MEKAFSDFNSLKNVNPIKIKKQEKFHKHAVHLFKVIFRHYQIDAILWELKFLEPP